MAPANDKKSKKKKKTKKKNNFDDDFALDSANVAKKLREKYKKQKQGEDDEVVIKTPLISSGKLVHPTRFSKFVERARKAQWNRISLPADAPKKILSTKWICSICQNYSCYRATGDLYGPYYMELTPDSDFIPDFLFSPGTQMPEKSFEDAPSIDVFVHGRCAMWADNLFFIGGKFPKLEERLNCFWKNKCKFCNTVGACIKYCPTENSLGHYQCLVDRGYLFDSTTFTITPPPKQVETNGEVDVLSYISSLFPARK